MVGMSDTATAATETWTIDTHVESARRYIPRGARYPSWKRAFRAAGRASIKSGSHVFFPRKLA